MLEYNIYMGYDVYLPTALACNIIPVRALMPAWRGGNVTGQRRGARKKRIWSRTPRKAKKKNNSERWDFCTNRENYIFFQIFFNLVLVYPPLSGSPKSLCVYIYHGTWYVCMCFFFACSPAKSGIKLFYNRLESPFSIVVFPLVPKWVNLVPQVHNSTSRDTVTIRASTRPVKEEPQKLVRHSKHAPPCLIYDSPRCFV